MSLNWLLWSFQSYCHRMRTHSCVPPPLLRTQTTGTQPRGREEAPGFSDSCRAGLRQMWAWWRRLPGVRGPQASSGSYLPFTEKGWEGESTPDAC